MLLKCLAFHRSQNRQSADAAGAAGAAGGKVSGEDGRGKLAVP